VTRIVATIEARMGSSRLPGKVLMEAAGRPMLHHLVSRLRGAESVTAIVLATSTHPQDLPLLAFAKEQGIASFAGSEDDVMSRVVDAAASQDADLVVEITGDCPLIDPAIVEQTIRMYFANPCAYASNVQVRSYPDGMDVQVFRLDALRRSAAMTSDPEEREHVSLHMRRNPGLFPQVHLVAGPDEHWPELGLTLDERADYELLRRIIEHYGDRASRVRCHEILALLRSRPDWLQINQHVRRKDVAT
jgi:spore coat polysaccharide biosynthesis protein SpsF